jgi:16S rRNA C967 or C1407 C5-methylase (RsmB/RsmF family)
MLNQECIVGTCAGAGGKTLHTCFNGKQETDAMDLYESKLKQLNKD